MSSMLHGIPGLEWIVLLVVRLAAGFFFAATGFSKLARPEKRTQMRETLKEAGIPLPAVSAVLTSAVEFGGGALVMVGLLTPLASIALATVMLVAIVTTQAATVEGSGVAWWTGFLYLPEVVYLLLLLWIAVRGAGPVSVDALLVAP